jgi:type IV pilus assembly protein PilA
MFSLQLPKRDERGFTLIELLVVIIIIGILAAIAIPLFLDQRKLAVDASVKSDVRNTATQVQTWLAQNPNTVATDVVDYKSKGGNISQSTGDTVNLSVATDGSYLVCGYAGTAAKAYTASSAAYVYDSATGRFGLGSCTGGIVGGGAPSSSAPPSVAPGGFSNNVYTSNFESGDSTLPMWSTVNMGSVGAASTAQANTGTSSYASTYTAGLASGNAGGGYSYMKFTPSPTFVVGKSYTITAYVYLAVPTTSKDRVIVQFARNGGATGTDSGITSGINSWQKVTFTSSTALDSGAYVRIYTQQTVAAGSPGASTGGTLYVDDITISQN